jgi:flagellar FliJ protein
MKASRSFLLAIDLATRQRDQAAQRLMHARSAYQFAQGQMEQLETYAGETELKWSATARAGTTPELVRHEYQFMNRLQYAIGLQHDVLANESRKVDTAKRLVLEAEFRLASLRQLVKKKQIENALVDARREQKLMDEFASLQTSRNRRPIATENKHED